MRKASPLVRISARNGLVAGVLGGLILIGTYYIMDVHPLLINPFLDFRIILLGVFIFITLKEYKSAVSGGVLYFWQGMISSYVLLMVYCVVVGLFIIIFSLAEPAFTESYTTQSVALLRENQDFIQKMGKEEFERNFAKPEPTNGLRLSFTYFLFSFFFGFFISLVLSVILRKQSPNL
jgi:hypothetical protein